MAPSMRTKLSQGAEIVLQTASDSADVFPPLKSVVGGTLSIFRLTKTFKKNRKDWDALEKDVEKGLAAVNRHVATIKRKSTLDADVAELSRYGGLPPRVVHGRSSCFSALSDVGNEIETFKSRPRLTRILALNDDRDEIDGMKEKINQAFSDFESELINAIPNVAASYNGSLHQELHACLPGTRTNLLERIHEWIDSTSMPRMLCLAGLAGTGKSTVAYTVAADYDALLRRFEGPLLHRLGASFFFSSASAAAGDGSQFFSTLVYQLALRDPSVRAAVVADPDVVREASSANVRVQYQRLLCAPLLAVRRTDPCNLVIVVDSLDLCASDMRRGILEFLMDLVQRVSYVRVLLTTRSDYATRDLLLSASRKGAASVYEMPRDVSDGDVARFLSHSLVVPEDNDLPPWEAQALHVNDLTQRSAGLFIFAEVAVRYIVGPALDGSDPAARLGVLLEATDPRELNADERSNPYSVLDKLYHQVLSSVPTTAVPTLSIALQFLCVRLEPLTLSSMARLLRDGLRKGDSVARTLTTVEALLAIPADDSLITLIHPSLLDYLTAPERCLDHRILVKPADAHALLAGACMSMMREELRRDQAVGGDVAAPSALGYACKFWASHLTAAGGAVSTKFEDDLRLFCRSTILLWLEWMAALSELPRALSSLQAAIVWCQDGDRSAIMHTEAALLDDARRMLLAFWEPISEDPQQIYRSALPFLPRSSPIRHQYANEQLPVRILRGLSDTWGSCDRTIATQCAEITSVAFSDDGELLASASRDGTVKLWATADGSCQAEFAAHTGACAAVQFISNGKSLFSAGGEGDCRIIIRDLKSQQASCAIQDETRGIVAAVWYKSSDGEFVASAAVEGEVRLWNTHSFQRVATLQGHSDAVTSVAVGVSSQSLLLCSCSDDQSVILWNLATFERTNTVRLDSACLCVAFSPDGLSLACGTQSGSITCWDLQGINLCKKWTTSAEHPVVSLCFIDDSKHLLAGRESLPLVQVMGSGAGEMVATGLSGHIYGLHSLAYSSRKNLLASASSDQTLCIYRAKDLLSAREEVPDSGRRPRCVAVSTSGVLAAVGYRNGNLFLHDLSHENETPCAGHRAAITSLTFCSDDGYLLSSSEDCDIRAWTTSTGACLRVFTSHTAEVTCLAAAPTGPLFVTGSHDKTVKLWDTQTEKALCSFFGHTKSLHAVAIRADNVASASGDCTVRLWSVVQRRSTRVLLGHSHAVGAVAFSLDGSRVASGSDSGEVIVWETKKGSVLFRGKLDAYTSIAADIRMHTVQFVKHDTAVAAILDDGRSEIFDLGFGEAAAGGEDGPIFVPESFDFAHRPLEDPAQVRLSAPSRVEPSGVTLRRRAEGGALRQAESLFAPCGPASALCGFCAVRVLRFSSKLSQCNVGMCLQAGYRALHAHTLVLSVGLRSPGHSAFVDMIRVQTLVSLAVWILAAVATPVVPMRQDMRGLNRLRNSTISGRAIFPSGGIRGVNLGAWFVFEPYMAIDEWLNMEGELCDDCTQCASDEFSLTRKLGQAKANARFHDHWTSWITQAEVNLMKSYGINSRSGCQMLRNAGISVLLDLHAAPGAQVDHNSFAGHCVATPGFWNQANFNRMNAAASALTTLIHQEPQNFGSVWGLEALNGEYGPFRIAPEPPTDANQTPGYFQFLQGFVNAVRGAENALNIPDANRISAVFMDISWQWQNAQNAANPAFTENGGNAYDRHVPSSRTHYLCLIPRYSHL
ncbi:WD40 repeat-like protein [Auricularia subglabra TFB-10046 SS5]|uniref:WD40 repeat-like protein n=1 Tax=Auricularia subglabra (strain TFB-10046 / SS5) TaxID=717982 RepID=J0LK59_AURST|nr:WD40 repeat-like protein [Auricularia subglabra TFB-10046 SS5]